MVTIGKPIGGGIPSGRLRLRPGGRRAHPARLGLARLADVGGIGGTLAGNALSLAAMRATLGEVLTEEAFARMIALGRALAATASQAVIDEFDLPWVVTRLGCRAEYWPRPVPPRNGGEAAAADDDELDRYLHLFVLNRGILMTPFHNMALMCAGTTTAADVDRHTEVFREAVAALFGRR